jgi:hypothetical protein
MITKFLCNPGLNKLFTTICICIIFFACKKNNSPEQYTYPTVSYTLHTSFRNQVYDQAHSSIYVLPTSFSLASSIYWDHATTTGGTRGTYTCEANNMGTFYRVHIFVSAPQVYDSATGFYVTTRSILSFNLPSINSFTNRNDTSVSIYIKDTAYNGNAKVSVNITKVDNNLLREPMPTIDGTFDMSGVVSNGYSLDSVSFASTGTFTNMPYR